LTFDLETPQALGSGNAAGSFAAAARNEAPALNDGEACTFDSTIILENNPWCLRREK